MYFKINIFDKLYKAFSLLSTVECATFKYSHIMHRGIQFFADKLCESIVKTIISYILFFFFEDFSPTRFPERCFKYYLILFSSKPFLLMGKLSHVFLFEAMQVRSKGSGSLIQRSVQFKLTFQKINKNIHPKIMENNIVIISQASAVLSYKFTQNPNIYVFDGASNDKSPN